MGLGVGGRGAVEETLADPPEVVFGGFVGEVRWARCRSANLPCGTCVSPHSFGVLIDGVRFA